jgi:hypothetical protein
MYKKAVFVSDEIVDAKVFTCPSFLKSLFHAGSHGWAGRPAPFPRYIEAADLNCNV